METNLMIAMFGPWEIAGLLFLALLLFGSKKLPELAKGLGTGLKEFKKATSDVTDELRSAIEDDPYSGPGYSSGSHGASRPQPPHTQPQSHSAPSPSASQSGEGSSSGSDYTGSSETGR